MLNDVEAVFENGVLRPLVSLPLAESEHVRLSVSRLEGDWLDRQYMAFCAAEADAGITLQAVRGALAKIHGSMDEAIDAERGER